MHCCGVASDQSSTEASRQIDKFLREEKRSCANKIKLLLLGIGDAGKSTFMKQMKLLHKNGFTPVEIERYKRIIHDNILTSMKQILEYTERSNIKLSSKLQNSITAVIKASELSPDVAQHVKYRQYREDTPLNYTSMPFSLCVEHYGHINRSKRCGRSTTFTQE
jgi:hypothetical protein